jgi:hypothetical protein
MVTVFLVGPYGVEPPSQMTPRLQRDSPSEANHRPEVGIGDAVASIAFVQWLTVREHESESLLQSPEREKGRLVSLAAFVGHSQ